MTTHPEFHSREEAGAAATSLIVALPGNAGYVLCVPWLKAARPGDVGGVHEYSAPVYMGHEVYPTEAAAQEVWRRRAGLPA